MPKSLTFRPVSSSNLFLETMSRLFERLEMFSLLGLDLSSYVRHCGESFCVGSVPSIYPNELVIYAYLKTIQYELSRTFLSV